MYASVQLPMLLMAEAAKIRAEIAKLESARKSCLDTRILEVIEFRIEERRLRLREIQSAPLSARQRDHHRPPPQVSDRHRGNAL